MPSDEFPPDALQHRFEMEDLSISPVTKKILGLAGGFSFGWPFDQVLSKVREHMGLDSAERIKLLLETINDELRKHDQQIRQLEGSLTAEDSASLTDTFPDLLLDGARKAENTRAKERVKRIGLILTNAIIEPKPPNADEIEEMMRIAMQLGDRDVEYLRELIRIEGGMLGSADHINRNTAHTIWERGWWGATVNTEIDSVCSKLESCGLVARLAPPNNLNVMADFQNRYVLLKKGLRFTDLIQSSSSVSSTSRFTDMP